MGVVNNLMYTMSRTDEDYGPPHTRRPIFSSRGVSNLENRTEDFCFGETAAADCRLAWQLQALLLQ